MSLGILKQLSSPHLLGGGKAGFFGQDAHPEDSRPLLQKTWVEPDAPGLPGGEAYLRGDPIPGLTRSSPLPWLLRLLLFPVLFPLVLVLLVLAVVGLWGFTLWPVITGFCSCTKQRLKTKSSKTAQLVCAFRFIGYQLALTNDGIGHYFLPLGAPVLIRLLSLERLLLGRGKVRDGKTGMISYIISRTQVFDRLVVNAINAGCRQVVLLGAGFDDRAHRLQLEGVRFFEVDAATTQAQKYAIVSRHRKTFSGKAIYVPTDFATEDFMVKLASAGFDKTQPSVFILEGVVMYLPWDAVRETLSRISAQCCPGTLLGLDAFEDGWSSAQARAKALYGLKVVSKGANGVGEPFKWGLRSDQVPRALFGELGFALLAHLSPGECEKRFLTPPGESLPLGRVAEFGHVFVLRVNGTGVGV